MGLGSGIRENLFRIPKPGPGVKKAPDPGSGSATLFMGVSNNSVDQCSGPGLDPKTYTKFSKIEFGMFIPDPVY
jgi:hypothetical protein